MNKYVSGSTACDVRLRHARVGAPYPDCLWVLTRRARSALQPRLVAVEKLLYILRRGKHAIDEVCFPMVVPCIYMSAVIKNQIAGGRNACRVPAHSTQLCLEGSTFETIILTCQWLRVQLEGLECSCLLILPHTTPCWSLRAYRASKLWSPLIVPVLAFSENVRRQCAYGFIHMDGRRLKRHSANAMTLDKASLVLHGCVLTAGT